MSFSKLPPDYFAHLRGEFIQAGWSVSGVRPTIKARCTCPAGHFTYIRSINLTPQYVKHKIDWLFNETCYADE